MEPAKSITGVLGESIESVRFCETMCVFVARLSPPPAPRSTMPLVVMLMRPLTLNLPGPSSTTPRKPLACSGREAAKLIAF